jgi:hypothetical protein
MSARSSQTVVLASSSKIGLDARMRVLAVAFRQR